MSGEAPITRGASNIVSGGCWLCALHVRFRFRIRDCGPVEGRRPDRHRRGILGRRHHPAQRHEHLRTDNRRDHWATAAIGMAVGFGLYIASIGGTALMLAALYLFAPARNSDE